MNPKENVKFSLLSSRDNSPKLNSPYFRASSRDNSPKINSLYFRASCKTSVMLLRVYFLAAWMAMVCGKCNDNEFECLHQEDGCIPYEDSCNGWIDCMRDGSDESPEECRPHMRRQPEGILIHY